MRRRIKIFSIFCRRFFKNVNVVSEVLVGLLITICLFGVGVSFAERWTIVESMYFSMITALTIGYGDLVPQTSIGRALSVVIGFTGMIFIGLNVAIATRTLADTTKELQE